MLIVLLVICIGLFIGGVCAYEENVVGFSALASGFIAIVIFVMLIEFPFNIDKKLAMYEEENLKIETKIKDTIKSYMEYEQETYDKVLKDADLTTIVLKYPELNSNELVKAEIEMYKENNKKIKELKEQQINKLVMAWWLYFGN